MSPLARSLFAATILAVAIAQQSPWDPSCSEIEVGQKGIYDIPLTPVDIPCPSGLIDSNHWCEDPRYNPYNMKLTTCGEHIEACNPNGNGLAPRIDVGAYTLTPITVTCTDNYESVATVSITVHCCWPADSHRNPHRRPQ